LQSNLGAKPSRRFSHTLRGQQLPEPLIGCFTHKLKNVVDPFVGNNLQKRRLLELYGQALSQGLIENWVSGGIGKLCDND